MENGHGINCAARNPSQDCTCGLQSRQETQTAETMYAAWRKRAEEAEAEVERPRKAWPIKGVRVEGEKVIVAVKGGNDAARWLCAELLAMIATTPYEPQIKPV